MRQAYIRIRWDVVERFSHHPEQGMVVVSAWVVRRRLLQQWGQYKLPYLAVHVAPW